MRVPGGRAGGFGCIGLLVVLAISLLTGADPRQLLPLLGLVEQMAPPPTAQSGGTPPPDDPQAQFIKRVLGSTEEVWAQTLQGRYREPRLVLFDGRVASACGYASSAVGPFYCPGDQQVYLDLSFFRELDRRFGAPGDFAQAYVIAHEVGHHVQNLLGLSDKVHVARSQVSETEYNQLSVRLELQADCLAGVWAYHADRSRQVVEPGDIDEALNAASQIGDDRLQKQGRGYVTPDSFTHGTSAQRARWFRQGFATGEFGSCDTFAAKQL